MRSPSFGCLSHSLATSSSRELTLLAPPIRTTSHAMPRRLALVMRSNRRWLRRLKLARRETEDQSSLQDHSSSLAKGEKRSDSPNLTSNGSPSTGLPQLHLRQLVNHRIRRYGKGFGVNTVDCCAASPRPATDAGIEAPCAGRPGIVPPRVREIQSCRLDRIHRRDRRGGYGGHAGQRRGG